MYAQFEGAGNSDSPYLLSSKADLEVLADLLKNPNDDNYKKFGFAHYKITRNIRNITTPIPFFSGVLDGQGFLLNLAIEREGQAGFIMEAIDSAIIKNIVTSGFVKGTWASGIVYSAVDNAYFNQQNGEWQGAKFIQIISCINTARIESSISAAGIIYRIQDVDVIIDMCKNIGSITSSDVLIGGGGLL